MVSLVEVQRVIAIPKTATGKAPLIKSNLSQATIPPGRTVVLVYSLNFFSTLLSSTAFVATVIELALMASAPTSGASRIPKG